MTGNNEVLSIGVLGAGLAGQAMAAFIDVHPGFRVTAVCDRRPEACSALAAANDLIQLGEAHQLFALPQLDAVFVATPTWLHAEHVTMALAAGKHVLVEKPMAVSAGEAQAMVDASRRAGKALVVGHSQSFEPPVHLVRAVIESGRLGPIRAINGWNYSDWMFRPRLPSELDRARGGGVVYRQAAHQIDMFHFITGQTPARVCATIGNWDAERPGDGAYNAFLTYPDGMAGSLFYSGYDRLRIDDFGRGPGAPPLPHGLARKAVQAQQGNGESAMKYGEAFALTMKRVNVGAKPVPFGFITVSCAGGDVLMAPDHVRVIGDAEFVFDFDGLPAGRQAVLDEFRHAIAGEQVTHDGEWGQANLETCLAMIAAHDSGAPVTLPVRAAHGVTVGQAARQRVATAMAH